MSRTKGISNSFYAWYKPIVLLDDASLKFGSEDDALSRGDKDLQEVYAIRWNVSHRKGKRLSNRRFRHYERKYLYNGRYDRLPILTCELTSLYLVEGNGYPF